MRGVLRVLRRKTPGTPGTNFKFPVTARVSGLCRNGNKVGTEREHNGNKLRIFYIVKYLVPFLVSG